MRFTVLIPTFDHGELIRPAIESVLAQSHADLELVVVADGSPDLTHDIVRGYAAQDPRVRLSAHDKGERHGEAFRHEVLAASTADAVCYLGDDDFWFPHHLETMSGLLQNADFAHTRLVFLTPTLTLGGYVGDLNDAATRAAMLSQPFNFFGPTVAGHRLDSYRRLPQGWAPAPPDVWTDLHMWRKWLAADGMRLHSSSRVTSIHLPRSARHGIDPALLALEPRTWYEAFKAPGMLQALESLLPRDSERLPVARVFAEACRIQEDRESARADLVSRQQSRIQELGVHVAALHEEARQTAARHEAALDEVRTSMALTAAALDECERALGARTEEVAQRTAEAAVCKQTASELQESLRVARAETLALRASSSWRITEPLRRLALWMRGRPESAPL